MGQTIEKTPTYSEIIADFKKLFSVLATTAEGENNWVRQMQNIIRIKNNCEANKTTSREILYKKCLQWLEMIEDEDND